MITKKAPVRRKRIAAVPTALAVIEPMSAALPEITALIGPCYVQIEGIGETVSDPANMAIGRRLALALAEIAKNHGEKTLRGVACNPNDAFELVSYDPVKLELRARLKPTASIMEQKIVAPIPAAFGTNLSHTATSRRAELPLQPTHRAERPGEVPRHWPTMTRM